MEVFALCDCIFYCVKIKQSFNMAKALEQLVATRIACLSSKADVFRAINVAYDGFLEAVKACCSVEEKYFAIFEQYDALPEEILDRQFEISEEILQERMLFLQGRRSDLVSLYNCKIRLVLKMYSGFETIEDHGQATKDLNCILEEVSNGVQTLIGLSSKTCGLFAASLGCLAA